MAALAEVEFIAGSAEDIVIPLTDDLNAPIASLAGWSGRVQVRYAPGSPLVLVQWDTADATMVLANSAARLVVSASLAETSLSWTWRLAWFDLRLVAPPGQGSLPNRPKRGIIRVVPGIST